MTTIQISEWGKADIADEFDKQFNIYSKAIKLKGG